MKFSNKVAIGINLNGFKPESFKGLQELSFLKDCEIHLVHFCRTFAWSSGEYPMLYPVEADLEEMQKSIMGNLKELAPKLLPNTPPDRIHSYCLFTEDPKSSFCQYLEKNNIDLVILSAREKLGLFDSSFTQYVNRHSHANLLILKPQGQPA